MSPAPSRRDSLRFGSRASKDVQASAWRKHSTCQTVHESPSWIHPCGRLDHDSEGLLLLTDDGKLNSRISEPKFKLAKTYWAQVDHAISNEALTQLQRGVMLNDGVTRPAQAQPPDLTITKEDPSPGPATRKQKKKLHTHTQPLKKLCRLYIKQQPN